MGKQSKVDARTRRDDIEGQRVAEALLSGAGLSGFTFSTGFVLRFSRNSAASYLDQPLPTEVELDLQGSWWFDDEREWRDKVARLAPAGAIEPDEPVQAYELAALRWSEGATVVSVVLSDGGFSARFDNGRVLNVVCTDGDSRAWTLTSVGAQQRPSNWSVCSEGGAIFVRTPGLDE